MAISSNFFMFNFPDWLVIEEVGGAVEGEQQGGDPPAEETAQTHPALWPDA